MFSVVMPHFKDVLEVKRKEHEETSNALLKIRKHLTLLKGEV